MKFIPSKPGVSPGEKEASFQFSVDPSGRPGASFAKRLRMWQDEWLYIECYVWRNQEGELCIEYDERGWTPAEVKQILDFAQCIKRQTDAAAKEGE